MLSMSFEITLVTGPAMTDEEDINMVALPFLNMIGYMPAGYDPRTGAQTVLESVPYRLFMDCFMGDIRRVWSVGEMARSLGTSIPTIYRHLDKLAALDLLGEGNLEKDLSRKGYFIRYRDLAQAWRFTEVNVELTLASYRKVVDLVSESIGPGKKEGEREPPRNLRAEGDFCLKVVNRTFDLPGKWEEPAAQFLTAIDYLSDIGKPDMKKAKGTLPFRLLTECILRKPDPGWTIDELVAHLDGTKPTVYRYLRKLGRLGVLERTVPGEAVPDGEAPVEETAAEKQPAKRRYRIRRGNLSKAWNATEWYARTVLKNYRRTVEHLARLAAERKN
jgi:DNA-binding transcriptional ArsR family regulator